jgi:hypothetical protein
LADNVVNVKRCPIVIVDSMMNSFYDPTCATPLPIVWDRFFSVSEPKRRSRGAQGTPLGTAWPDICAAHHACSSRSETGTLRVMRKPLVFRALFILLLGFPPFMNSLSNPRLAGLRVPDRLQLFAVGFCVGTAFGTLMTAWKSGRSRI